MKYWGRSLLVFLTIITVLYGTKEVWPLTAYNRAVHEGPAHTTFSHEPAGYRGDRRPVVTVGGMGGTTFGAGGSGYR